MPENYTATILDGDQQRLFAKVCESSKGVQFITLEAHTPAHSQTMVLDEAEARFLSETLLQYANNLKSWEASGGDVVKHEVQK